MKLFRWLKSFRNRGVRRGRQRRAGLGRRSLPASQHFGIMSATAAPSVEGLEDRTLLSTVTLVGNVTEAQSTVQIGPSLSSSFTAVSGLSSTFTVSDTDEVYRFSGTLSFSNDNSNPSTFVVEVAFFVDGAQG